MNFQHREPEEQGDHFAAAWCELKMRHSLARFVFMAALFSIEAAILSRPLHLSLLLLSCAASMGAIKLSSRFLKAFRCPNCGQAFFGPEEKVGIGPLPITACAHCELPPGAGGPTL